VHLVPVINLSLPYIRATSSHIPENFLLKAHTVLLPNDGVLPTASVFTGSCEEIFSAEWHFVTKLSPQVSPFPVPIFGVNKFNGSGAVCSGGDRDGAQCDKWRRRGCPTPASAQGQYMARARKTNDTSSSLTPLVQHRVSS
jgi:hypothetical protein